MTEAADVLGEAKGAATSSDLLELVSFKLGHEEFGVEIRKVREINRMLDVTRIPNSPAYMEGVVNLRGKVIPVINLRRRFGMEEKAHDKDVRVVVVELGGKVLGFVVDSVSQVLRIPRSVTEPPPSLMGGVGAEYITAVGKLEDRLLILLDLEKIFSSAEQKELREVA